MITSKSHRKLYKWAWGKVLVVAKSGSLLSSVLWVGDE